MTETFRHLLGVERISTFYQAIVSIKSHEIIAYEALTRAWNNVNQPISPENLFSCAFEKNCLEDLDSFCQENALRSFPSREKGKQKILSLNLPSCLFCRKNKDHFVLDLVDRLQFNKSFLMLEVCEDEVTDQGVLLAFIQRCHEEGILVALDDLGKKCSNLDRIVSLVPDVVKLDRCLIQNIHQNSMQQAVVKSMVELCNSMGSLLLAEGAETKEEVLSLLELGINFFQGFYFSRPVPEADFKSNEKNTMDIIENTGSEFTANCKIHFHQKKLFWNNVVHKAKMICQQLESYTDPTEIHRLESVFLMLERADCIYILDQRGIQISQTLFSGKPHLNCNKFFTPAAPGSDHGQKDYFLYLKPWTEAMARNEHIRPDFISHRYRSMATGASCQTYCRWFMDGSGRPPYLLR